MQNTLNQSHSGHPERHVVSAHKAFLAEQKQCGHHSHIGTCPVCQRAQLLRWQVQLAEVS